MVRLRILALHGCGTSAEIWRAQSHVEAFVSHLPPEWSLIFVDGEEECQAADGIAAVFPFPYLCYYSIPLFSSIQAAHALVHEVIAEEGPFDGVMGFSQGAALAASVILHHQDEHPFAQPLFRFAVFINGSLPYSKTSKLGVDVTHIFARVTPNQAGVFTPTDDDEMIAYDDYCDIADSMPIRRFSPRTHTDRIGVPTAHIFGRNDQWKLQSLQLMKLCDGKQATSFEHVGGHDVPKTADQSKGIARAIIRTFEYAHFRSA